jgi:hypothetical protein
MRRLFTSLVVVTLIAIAYWTTVASLTATERFLNTANSWNPATCDLGPRVVRVGQQDLPDIDLQTEQNNCQNQVNSLPDPSSPVVLGQEHPIGEDTSPRYLDRVYAGCDNVGQVMTGFRVNTNGAGTENGTIQGSAMCTKELRRQNNTKTSYSPYVFAPSGVASLKADCQGKAMVGVGFETDPQNDDRLRLRFDCAYDVETLPASQETYFTGWYGDGDAVDALDQHTVKCPLSNYVLSGMEYVKCPNTQDITATFSCVPTTGVPVTSLDPTHEVYAMATVQPPNAELYVDVTGIMQYDEELKQIFQPLGQNVKNTAIEVGRMATRVGDGAVQVGKGLGSLFKGVGNGFVSAGNNVARVVRTRGKDIETTAKATESNFTSIPKHVRDKSIDAKNRFVDPELKRIGGLGGKISGEAGRFKTNLVQLFNGIIDGVPKSFTSFENTAKTCFQSVEKAWAV